MNIYIVRDWDSLRGRCQEWDAIVGIGRPEDAFVTFEWWDALRAAFGRSDCERTLVAEEGERLATIWPLRIVSRRAARVLAFSELADPSDWFTPHYRIACAGDAGVIIRRCIEFLLTSVPGWDVLEVRRLIVGDETHVALASAGRGLGMDVECRPGPISPYVPIAGTWEHFLAKRSAGLRKEIHRRERQIRDLGRAEVEVRITPDELREGLAVILDIERRSWKHGHGSAITSRPWEQAFYTQLIETAGARRWLRQTTLRLDGRPIAYDLSIIRGRRWASLKSSFDEAFREVSPGTYLLSRLLEACHSSGASEFDFLGEPDPSKMRWTQHTRRHVSLALFRRNPRARLLRAWRTFTADRHAAAAPTPVPGGGGRSAAT